MAKRTSRRNAERENAWREAVRKQQASGLSIREFCRQEGLPEPSFYAWRRTLLERDASDALETTREEPAPPFVPVSLVAATNRPAGFALELRGGRTLRLPESLSVEQLAAIVRAIEREVAP